MIYTKRSKPENDKMKKSEDKAEKRIMSMLWKKTEKDGNEHGILIGGRKILELAGDENEISDKTWAKAKWLLLDNLKLTFRFYHTHPGWDCPLSGDDIAVFLRYKNLRSMIAITKENIYTITKTKQSIHIDYTKSNEMCECHKEYTSLYLKDMVMVGDQHYYNEDYKEALCKATIQLADEYKFKCKEEELLL